MVYDHHHEFAVPLLHPLGLICINECDKLLHSSHDGEAAGEWDLSSVTEGLPICTRHQRIGERPSCLRVDIDDYNHHIVR